MPTLSNIHDIRDLTNPEVPVTAMRMRPRVVCIAIRFLLTFMMVVAGGARLARAATPPDQDSPTVTTAPRGKTTRAAKHHEKQEAHKGVEPHGKAQGGKEAKGGEQKGPSAAPVAVIPPPPKPAAQVEEPGEPAPKLPRFEALKTDDTNMRKGPGQRYPIEWVYKRHDLPMEVERQYDVWRYVRDPDGVEGWVHQVTLSDRRTFMIQNKDATLRSDAKDTASPVAVLKVGVIGRLRECDQGSNWCQVQVGGYRGYLRRDQLWGLLPDEVVGAS
jgi:SH3-like domain-containing protein